MGNTADNLYVIATDILDVALAALSENRTGNRQPGRAFVCIGQPPGDACPDGQLTVGLGEIEYRSHLPHRQAPSQLQLMPIAPFTVTLMRCVPVFDGETGNPATLDDIDEAMRALYYDGQCMFTGVVAASMTPYGLSSRLGSRSVEVRRTTAIQPQGGIAGWAITLGVLLDDAGPEG